MKNKNIRYFLLIEVLSALFLVTILSFTLISSPIYFYRYQMKSLKEMELQRVADLSFLAIQLKLLNNEISFEDIRNSATLSDLEENNLLKDDINIFKSYKFILKKTKVDLAGNSYHKALLELNLSYSGYENNIFNYELLFKEKT